MRGNEKKVSILIEEEVIRQAKRFALNEDRPLRAIIQDALVWYLREKVPDPRKREKAYQLFCEKPMCLSRKQFKEILKEENFNSTDTSYKKDS